MPERLRRNICDGARHCPLGGLPPNNRRGEVYEPTYILKERRKKAMPKKYSNDLKRNVLLHYHNNCSLNETSESFDIPKKTLEKWLAKYRREGEYAYDEMHLDKDRYIEELERKITNLEETIELLKKALAFLQSSLSKNDYL